MAEQGLVARRRRRRRGATRPGKGRWRAPDLVKRDFAAEAINHKWFGDGTEIDTDEGKLFLDSVLDVRSRRIVGLAMSEHHDTECAYGALAIAVAVRGGRKQSVASSFTPIRAANTPRSGSAPPAKGWASNNPLGRPGSALDNAIIESRHSTLEFELRAVEHFTTKAEARARVAAWIDDYNRHRRHSALNMQSPISYELTGPEAA
jgi:putative transposase